MSKKELYEQILSCINQLQSLQYGPLSMQESELLTNFEKEIVFMSYRTGMNLEVIGGVKQTTDITIDVQKLESALKKSSEELYEACEKSIDMSLSAQEKEPSNAADNAVDQEVTSVEQEVDVMEEEKSMQDSPNRPNSFYDTSDDAKTDENEAETAEIEEEKTVIPEDFSERVHDLGTDEEENTDSTEEDTVYEEEMVEIDIDDTEDIDDSDEVDEGEEEEYEEEEPQDEVVSVNLDVEDDATEETEGTKETSVLINGMPSFHSVEDTELFTDETRKSLTDFVYSRKVVALKGEETASRAAIAERLVISTFPLSVSADDGNAKIFAVVEHDGQMYHASSYDNRNGSSIVQMKIDGFEIFIMGMWENYQFHTRVMTTGQTALDEITIEEMETIDNTPVKNRIKNGHIKFAYEDSGNDIGTIEVFPVSDSSDKTHLFYIRKVDAFTDYGELGQRVVTINTIEGYKNLSINVIQGDLEVTLISQEL